MKKEWRKRYRVLFLAALVVALTVPLGFALSVPPSTSPSVFERRTESIAASVTMPSHISVSSTVSPAGSRQLLEAIKLVAVGSLLMGCASIARKA
jgi:hypothetical protein